MRTGDRLLSQAPTGAARGLRGTRFGSPTCGFQLCYSRRVLQGCLGKLPAAEQLVAVALEVTGILGSSGLPGVRVVGATGRLCLPRASRLLGSGLRCPAPTRSPAALAPTQQLLLDVAHGARGRCGESSREVNASPGPRSGLAGAGGTTPRGRSPSSPPSRVGVLPARPVPGSPRTRSRVLLHRGSPRFNSLAAEEQAESWSFKATSFTRTMPVHVKLAFIRTLGMNEVTRT